MSETIIRCKCGNVLLDQYATDGDLCLYCRETEKVDKPMPSKTRYNTRNQYTTGFYK